MEHEDILKYIEETSPNYTPEWRFDRDFPDMGSAFALTFADMFSETYSKYQRLMEKHHIEFINSTGIEPVQKQAAEGYVCFSLAHGAPEGCLVDKDTPVYSDDDIVFTTTQRRYITPAKLQDIYYCAGDCFYWAGDGQESFILFGKAENLQLHDLYIGHEWLFDLSQRAEICLIVLGENLHLLGEQETVCWQYFTGEWVEFSRVWYSEGRVYLTSDHEVSLIRCRALSPKAAEIMITGMSLKMRNPEPAARKIYQDGIEILDREFYPFSKSLSAFSCCYIACTEAFGKKGARIQLSFDLTLISQDIQNPAPEIPVQWRAVMHKKELEPPPVYEALIESVIIEYWNGRDFVALITEEPVKMLFSESGRNKTIVFQCPEDMHLVSMYGFESRWIRLRILNVANEYRLNTRHITPYIRDLEVRWSYNKELPPCRMYAENKGERTEGLPLKPFSFLPENEYAVYFGFDKPFEGSPVGFLWDVEPCKSKMEIRWYTFCRNQWRPIIVNGDFWRTGCTAHYSEEPMDCAVFFGKKGYWMMAKISGEPTEELRVRNLYSGAVPVTQKTEEKTAFLSIQAKDTVKLFDIDTSRVCDLNVFVDERDELGRQNFVKWNEDDDNSYKILDSGILFDEYALRRIYRHKEASVIQIRFRMTEGQQGNLKNISKVGRSIGYISGVTNPLPVSGGRGIESLQRILSRSSGKLVDGNRAVTMRSYESLALEASIDIVKCQCIPGVDDKGGSLRGAVTLIYLPKDFDSNPRRSAGIGKYLADRASPQVKIFVRESIFVEISVTARITVSSRYIIKSRESIELGLGEFLHPIHGNFDKKGFSIGEMPSSDHILSYLYSFDNVECVNSFAVEFVSTDNFVREEIDIKSFPNIRFCVPLSGAHHIKVVYDDTKLKS